MTGNKSMKQISLLKKTSLAYGGSLLKTRKGRSCGRPLSTKDSMHLVLRSSKAVGAFSFRTTKNSQAVRAIVDRFSRKYGVTVLSLANVGNHLHFHIKLSNRQTYKPFIRAITAAIAMAVTGASRWQKSKLHGKFWDHRPFTRVVLGFSALLKLKDYIQVNQLEGLGVARISAYYLVHRQNPTVSSTS